MSALPAPGGGFGPPGPGTASTGPSGSDASTRPDDGGAPGADAASVSSVVSGLEVLFAIGTQSLTATSVATRLGRDRSQVSRTLSTCERADWLERQPDRSYRASRRLATLAWQVSAVRLERAGHEAVSRLAEATRMIARLAVLRGEASVTVAESYPARTRQMSSWLGRSFPAYASESGQALLIDTDLDELRTRFASTRWVPQSPRTPRDVEELHAAVLTARAQGYAVMDESAGPGRLAVGAPVRSFTGEVVAAIFAGCGGADRDAVDPHQIGITVRAAADELSRALGCP